jgi:transposase InsO family protein
VALVKSDEDALTKAIVGLAAQYGRYGYKRVRPSARGRLWVNDGSCVRLRPEHPNHVWAHDFLMDRTHEGRAFRMLTVIDEYTRECLAIVVNRRINSNDVLYTLADLFIRRGIPAHIRSDNGPEFCAKAVREWLSRLGVGTLFIEPGSPSENRCIESFNGKLRDELLNREIFYTLKEASILIEQWRRHYNGVRPHSALGYRPPAPETIAFPAFGFASSCSSLAVPWIIRERSFTKFRVDRSVGVGHLSKAGAILYVPFQSLQMLVIKP